jgi:Saf4/Yju2 protein
MSSLSATQADGYYLPAEYFESGAYKKKSKNQFSGSKGHNQYEVNGVVRFELPYDGFCLGCGAHVSRGTRFNAEKIKKGNYFSTVIWEFKMKCRICAKQEFIIKTNPKEQAFDYVDGIHKQLKDFDTSEAGTAGIIDIDHANEVSNSLGLDRLQTIATGKIKALSEHEQLQAILRINENAYLDDAANNSSARANFRMDRCQKNSRLDDASKLGWRRGMELLSENTLGDIVVAKSTTFGSGKQQESENFRLVRKASIFEAQPKAKKQKRFREVFPDCISSSKVKSEAAHVPEPIATPTTTKRRSKMKVVLATNLGYTSITALASIPSTGLDALACYHSDSD